MITTGTITCKVANEVAQLQTLFQSCKHGLAKTIPVAKVLINCIHPFCYSNFNPLVCKSNYNATSNDIKLVHWLLMGKLLHLVQRGRDCVGPQSAQVPACCTKCNSPSING